MTRIGILTFHNTVNYGAVLQAYALQKTIENLGYEVSIIDYRNPAVTARETFSVPKLSKLIVDPRSYFGEMNAYHAFHYRKNKFEHFIDKENLGLVSYRCCGVNGLDNVFIADSLIDLHLVGSGSQIFPLYLYPTERSKKFLAKYFKSLGGLFEGLEEDPFEGKEKVE